MSTLVEEALVYGKLGWAVFPCSPRDKKPLTKNGFKDASTDPAVIQEWWNRWPAAMIAISCGASGLVVLDVDLDVGKGIDGEASLKALLNGTALPPDATTARTPRGGKHIYFTARNDLVVANSAGKLGPGLDVRAAGGYVVCPPSVNSNGVAYQWDPWGAFHPAPDWLAAPRHEAPVIEPPVHGLSLNESRRRAYAETALKGECDRVAVAQDGARNDTLFKAACRLFELVAGDVVSEGEARNALIKAAQACGLDDQETEKTLSSAFAHGASQPRGVPDNGSREQHPMGRDPEAGAAATVNLLQLMRLGLARYDTEPIPEREWGVPGRFPKRTVVLLSGHGGIGKSIIMLQLAVAHILGRDWLRSMPEPGPVLLVNCEDEGDELVRRLEPILKFYHAKFIDIASGLHAFPLVEMAGDLSTGQLLATADRGVIRPTKLYQNLLEVAGEVKPVSVIVDNVADVYGGSEIDRSQVQQFVRLMRRVSFAANGYTLLSAHPSLRGLESKSGLSGTTQWHNSVRARGYLRSLGETKEAGTNNENGNEGYRSERVLEFLKSNYSPLAEVVNLRWADGHFQPTPSLSAPEQAASRAAVDAMFLQLLERSTERRENISASRTANNYAPSMFAKTAEARAAHFGREDFAGALDRLIDAGGIAVELYGPPTRLASRLIKRAPP